MVHAYFSLHVMVHWAGADKTITIALIRIHEVGMQGLRLMALRPKLRSAKFEGGKVAAAATEEKWLHFQLDFH